MKNFFYLIALLALAGALIIFTGQLPRRLSVEQLKTAMDLAVSLVELKDVAGGVPIELDEIEKIQRSGKKIVWLDVRSPEERSVSWIPGSRPSEGFSSDTIATDREVVVVYDTIGADALPKAQQLNLDKRWSAVVRNLRGGTVAWALAGKSFETPQGPSKKLRISSGVWNFVPKTYDVTW